MADTPPILKANGDFNSQPHEEADGIYPGWVRNKKDISTHSLTKRLTFARILHFFGDVYFNSQPHEEADSLPSCASTFCSTFQLTASRRG